MNNRRERVGWYFYDWANSAFYTTVITVFFGPYLTVIAKAAAESLGEGNTLVYPLGIKVFKGSFFPYVVALSVGLQMVFLPILGAIADSSHRKKQMLACLLTLEHWLPDGDQLRRGVKTPTGVSSSDISLW